jgi:two-component system response regulator VicR
MYPDQATVLVADDDELIVTVITMALQDQGYVVLAASNGAEAAAAHTRAKIGLTVLDAHMSGYSLNESVAAIRNSAEDANAPILVLSGASVRPPELRDPNIGYLAKPVDLDVLRREVARLIEPTSAGKAP